MPRDRTALLYPIAANGAAEELRVAGNAAKMLCFTVSCEVAGTVGGEAAPPAHKAAPLHVHCALVALQVVRAVGHIVASVALKIIDNALL
jgi:hypothetical protein